MDFKNHRIHFKSNQKLKNYLSIVFLQFLIKFWTLLSYKTNVLDISNVVDSFWFHYVIERRDGSRRQVLKIKFNFKSRPLLVVHSNIPEVKFLIWGFSIIMRWISWSTEILNKTFFREWQTILNLHLKKMIIYHARELNIHKSGVKMFNYIACIALL